MQLSPKKIIIWLIAIVVFVGAAGVGGLLLLSKQGSGVELPWQRPTNPSVTGTSPGQGGPTGQQTGAGATLGGQPNGGTSGGGAGAGGTTAGGGGFVQTGTTGGSGPSTGTPQFSGGSVSGSGAPGGATTSSMLPANQAISETSFESAFAQLNATKIVFTDVSASASGDYKSLYALYAADIAMQKAKQPGGGTSLAMALVDLNGDGSSEALVIETLPYFCGTGGCNLDIYQKQSGKWIKIATTLVSGDLAESSVITNNYADLILTVQVADQPNQSVVVRYSWDGSTYRLTRVLGAWGSGAFEMAK